MPEKKLTPMQPQQIVEIVDAIIREERPVWSRKALARVFALIFPKFQAKRVEECLADPSRLTRLMAMLKEDEGWVIGRVHRAMCEARAERLLETPPLVALAWLETVDLATGAPQGGSGINGAIGGHFENVLQWPASQQISFWKSFADAFAQPLTTHQHNAKTILAYVFIGLNWQEVAQCKTIRDA